MEPVARYDTITLAFLEEWLPKYDEAWRTRDGGAMAALCAEDVVWDDAALPEPARGPAEVAAFIRFNFAMYPDLRFDAPDPPAISTDGTTAYLKWVLEGTNTGPIDPPGFAPTGRRVEQAGIDEYRFREGLLAHYRAYYDMHAMLTQLGLSPRRDSRTFGALVRLQRLGARIRR